MNLLAEILSSRTRAEMFRLLFGAGSQGSFHLREIERRTGLSTGSLRQEAAKLQRLGLITCRKDGNRTYYEANRSHPLYQDIHHMVLKTVGLVDLLKESLGTTGIQCAFVFGSIAQGTAKAESDIDLMVVGSIGLRKLSSRISGVGNLVGREINPHVFTPGEYRDRVQRKEHFVTNVMESPRLFVVGSADDLEVMGK
jgi:predicted nucleotidyltransferase